jgi:hypothetical protein
MNLAAEPLPEGMGQAAFLLMIGLLSRLRARGLLSDDDLRTVMDEATFSLEQFGGLSVPELKGAHSLMEALLEIFSGSPPKPPA